MVIVVDAIWVNLRMEAPWNGEGLASPARLNEENRGMKKSTQSRSDSSLPKRMAIRE